MIAPSFWIDPKTGNDYMLTVQYPETQIRNFDDLRAIPTTVKAELRRSEEEHPPFGDYRGAPASAAVRLGASTGTSGRPTLILWTRRDLEVCRRGAGPLTISAGRKRIADGVLTQTRRRRGDRPVATTFYCDAGCMGHSRRLVVG